MKFKEILNEFIGRGHFWDRLNQRFLDPPALDVVAFSNDGRNRKVFIGKFVIPNDVKAIILKKAKKLADPFYVGDPDLAFIVELYEFIVNPETVKLTDPKYIAFFKDRNNWRVLLQEPPDPKGQDKPSNGYYLVCIIRNNAITTVFLSRTKNIEYIKEKTHKNYGAENFVFIKDVDNELDSYLDIDSIRKRPQQQPQLDPEPQPEKPLKPELTDKEKRLEAYKERMKKLYGGKK